MNAYLFQVFILIQEGRLESLQRNIYLLKHPWQHPKPKDINTSFPIELKMER